MSSSHQYLPPAGEAKAICATCPVREECLEYALETNQDSGIWGGLDEEQRQLGHGAAHCGQIGDRHPDVHRQGGILEVDFHQRGRRRLPGELNEFLFHPERGKPRGQPSDGIHKCGPRSCGGNAW